MCYETVGLVINRVSYEGKPEDTAAQLKAKPAVQVQTKDDAYDMFMKEMAGLL